MKEDYKSYVCPTSGQFGYYVAGAMLFANSVTTQNIKPHHKVLDIGCGSLRVGKHFISYLDEGNYHAIEPEAKWLNEGINNELSKNMIKQKKPRFSYSQNFEANEFNETFDFVLAFNVFIHCGPDQFRQCLINLKEHLSQEGVFIFSALIGEGPSVRFKKYRHSDGGISIFSLTQLDSLLAECGFVRTGYIRKGKGRNNTFTASINNLPSCS